ncbi:MAG: SDR family oxidoreductase, partial [Planctomycetes bacterium]|nr:SDR family oxidoreductase [Planctomycetota bacterium]
MNSSAKNKTPRRTVLVTGCTGGIGRAVAVTFAQNGWNVVGHDCISGDKARQLKACITAHGVDFSLIKADFSSKRQVNRFIAQAAELRIDSLINNAGGYLAAKHFTELQLEDLSAALMVNLSTPILLSGCVFDGMKRRKFGRIVNISSIAAKYGGSGSSVHYRRAQPGVGAPTQNPAPEGAPPNILGKTNPPGAFDTGLHRQVPQG